MKEVMPMWLLLRNSVGDHDGVIAEVIVVKESWGCC